MTAITDLTTICTILKGSAPTNAQMLKVAALYQEHWTVDNPTNEQKAAAALVGMRRDIRRLLRAAAEAEVYGPVIAQAHMAADQPAMLAAAKAAAVAAGDAAEGSL